MSATKMSTRKTAGMTGEAGQWIVCPKGRLIGHHFMPPERRPSQQGAATHTAEQLLRSDGGASGACCVRDRIAVIL